MNGDVPSIDLRGVSKRPHNYGEIFFDLEHHTENGYELVADKLFERLQQEHFFVAADPGLQGYSPTYTKVKDAGNSLNLDNNVRKELDEYKRILTDFYDSMFGIKIGAVVMNCNPFTLGTVI